MSARDDVLARIAGAHRSAPPPDLPYEGIARDYRTGSDLEPEALVERLVDRLVDYKALVRRCAVAPELLTEPPCGIEPQTFSLPWRRSAY